MPIDPAFVGLAINGITKLFDSKYGDKILEPVGETAKPKEQKRREESDRRRGRSGGHSKKKYRRPKRPERRTREPIDVDALAADELAAHEAEKGRGDRDTVYRQKLNEFHEARNNFNPHGRGSHGGDEKETGESGGRRHRRESADVNADRKSGSFSS